MTFVIDTNVLKVANGGDWLNLDPQCVRTCVKKLGDVKNSGRVALNWEIIGEYKRNLRESGEPGDGDAFLKWLLSNVMNSLRCDFVEPADFPDDPRLAAFDLADRKFVTVARGHAERPPILQAKDSKWPEFAAPLAEYGVIIDFLCA